MSSTAPLRLFFAIPLPLFIQNHLQTFIKPWRKELIQASHLKWTPPENWHMTLKFLGHCDEKKATSLIEAAQSVLGAVLPFEINLEHLHFFPSPQLPHTLAITSSLTRPLFQLVETIEQMSIQQGFQKESRAFLPHITLARLTRPKLFPLPTFIPISFTSTECVLMKSEEIKKKRIYTPIAKFPFSE